MLRGPRQGSPVGPIGCTQGPQGRDYGATRKSKDPYKPVQGTHGYSRGSYLAAQGAPVSKATSYL